MLETADAMLASVAYKARPQHKAAEDRAGVNLMPDVNAAPKPLSAIEEWRRHGMLVLAAMVGFSFYSFMSPATGLFMAPLQAEFGWSRALLSSGSLIGAVMSLLLSPWFGALIDRRGSRTPALFGIVGTAIAVAAFATLTASPWHWLALWFVFGLAGMTLHATTWTTAVAGVFTTSRGLALGAVLAGSALSSAVVPPLANWVIADFGWRVAYVVLGLGWGGLALLGCLVFLFDSHDNYRKAKRDNQALKVLPLTGLSIAEAWRDRSLWRVAIATLLILTVTIGTTVHQVPIVESAGLSRGEAAWLASAAGIAGIIGKVVTGVLVDRFPVRWVGGVTLASTAIAYPLLLEPLRTSSLVILAMLINGYAAGTKLQLCGYLTARYGGMRNYGAIFGFMASLIALAGGSGPILAGLAFDLSGDYGAFLIAGTVISLVSGALVFSLGPYPNFAAREEVQP